MDDGLFWEVRALVYDLFGKTARPPSADEIARLINLDGSVVEELFAELHHRHTLFLDSETHTIRMAWPFSGIPTRFLVHAKGLTYWANCAWDSLGIPAALHTDAEIEAVDAWSKEPIHLVIRSGQPIHAGERIHFLTPFTRWYDDLVFT